MISGDYLVANISGTLVEGVMAWSVSESCVKLNGQTGVHRRFSANEQGTRTATIKLQIVQDITSTPYTPVAADTTISDLELYHSIDDATPAFVFPTANVFDSDNGSQMGDKFVINSTAENYGSYTRNDPGS